jgi:hypothetical protein
MGTAALFSFAYYFGFRIWDSAEIIFEIIHSSSSSRFYHRHRMQMHCIVCMTNEKCRYQFKILSCSIILHLHRRFNSASTLLLPFKSLPRSLLYTSVVRPSVTSKLTKYIMAESVTSSRAVVRDISSATLGSICCCYVGQPFDTGLSLVTIRCSAYW